MRCRKLSTKTTKQESGFAAFFPQGCSEIAEQFPSIPKNGSAIFVSE